MRSAPAARVGGWGRDPGPRRRATAGGPAPRAGGSSCAGPRPGPILRRPRRRWSTRPLQQVAHARTLFARTAARRTASACFSSWIGWASGTAGVPPRCRVRRPGWKSRAARPRRPRGRPGGAAHRCGRRGIAAQHCRGSVAFFLQPHHEFFQQDAPRTGRSTAITGDRLPQLERKDVVDDIVVRNVEEEALRSGCPIARLERGGAARGP